MTAIPLNAGDAIQLDPAHHPKFAACFATVDEVRGWGVIATVLVPGGERPGEAPVRLEFGTFVKVGRAEWTKGGEQP